MAPVTPFKISVPDADIERLKQKLSLATFPQDVDFSDSWDYGAPLGDIKRLAARWLDGFDWRAAEARLNAQLPQFTTPVPVDGFGDVDLHFVHQRSDRPDAIPLLFCHGWPGSFLEVVKILPLLVRGTDDDQDDQDQQPTFHVVAPSLPNYGFSAKVTRPGFSPAQYAEACHRLMLALGYDRYVTQGGDWGYIITRLMGARYGGPRGGGHVLASHLNMVNAARPPTLLEAGGPLRYARHRLAPHTAAERAGLARTAWFRQRGFGYNLEQSTRPHTLGFALADSPVALLAWVYEKLHDWTDAYPWSDDEVLTWVGIYAFSRAGPDASVRIYYEQMNSAAGAEGAARAAGYVPGVPLGLSYFPRDLVVPPSAWGHSLGPVVFERRHEDGGHFAAYERPERLVEDLRAMFGKGGGAESAVKKLKTRSRM